MFIFISNSIISLPLHLAISPQAELEKPKSDAVTQTSLETAEVESQTEKPALSTTEVQTIWSSMVSVDGWAQTKFLATVTTAAQTEASVTTDTSSQTQGKISI